MDIPLVERERSSKSTAGPPAKQPGLQVHIPAVYAAAGAACRPKNYGSGGRKLRVRMKASGDLLLKVPDTLRVKLEISCTSLVMVDERSGLVN